MVCRSCHDFEFVLQIQSNQIRQKSLISFDFKDFAVCSDANFKCESCGNMVYEGEYYFDDEDFKDNICNEIGKELADIINEDIESCEECGHGEFMNSLHHSINKTFNEEGENPEEIFESYNFSTEIGDFIDSINTEGVPHKYVLEYLSCPHCKSGTGENYDDKINYGKWNAYTTIYTIKDIEDFNQSFYGDEKTYNLMKTEINRIAEILSYEEILELRDEYIINPLLIKNDSLNKIIYLINDLFIRDEGYVLDEFFSLYRARINDLQNVFTKNEMWEPPLNNATQGRYNPNGFSVLYLGNSIDSIKKEVPLKKGKCYNIGIFKIKQPLRFFMINQIFDGEFNGLINEEVPFENQNQTFKNQYVITNIISMIIKNVGFNGIAYYSTKSPVFVNFAVINFNKDEDIEILDVTI